MKALVLEKNKSYPSIKEISPPEIADNQVIVQLKAAAINHRDLWILKGMYPGIEYPAILGSDGVGIVDGNEVIIQPGIDWGGEERFQSKDYHILGLPWPGTFAEAVPVNEKQIFDKPSHLSFEEAAALPLGGLTAFRVLFTRCKGKQGEKILITGIGGGVALFCCQFALAEGMDVYVTSSSDLKIEKAKALGEGVKGGANYRNPDWPHILKEQVGDGFDIVIDSAGGEAFSELVKLCNPGARIGIYGGTQGKITNLSPQIIFWRQISILGSTMGSDKDFVNMLEFVNAHKIVPVVDSVFPLEHGWQAFEKLEKGEQFGKLVLSMG